MTVEKPACSLQKRKKQIWCNFVVGASGCAHIHAFGPGAEARKYLAILCYAACSHHERWFHRFLMCTNSANSNEYPIPAAAAARGMAQQRHHSMCISTPYGWKKKHVIVTILLPVKIFPRASCACCVSQSATHCTATAVQVSATATGVYNRRAFTMSMHEGCESRQICIQAFHAHVLRH
jgi:hypothetical protein